MPIDPRDRDRELAIQLRMQMRLERSLRRRMGPLLNTAIRKAAEGYQRAGIVGVGIALEGHMEDVRRALGH